MQRLPPVFYFIPSTRDCEELISFASDKYVAVYDLEDAVPMTDKEVARNNIARIFSVPSNFKRAVRVNAINTADGLRDLLAVRDLVYQPDIIELPMVEHPEEARIGRDILALRSPECSQLWTSIETPQALSCIYDLAAAFDGIIFGSADLTAKLVVDQNWENLLLARMLMTNAAAAHGIPAIDTPCFILNDPQALIEESMRVKNLGFYGKCAVHPTQIDAINHIFNPTQSEIDNAKLMIKKFDENSGRIFKHEGNMVGPPMVARAKNLLSRVSEA